MFQNISRGVALPLSVALVLLQRDISSSVVSCSNNAGNCDRRAFENPCGCDDPSCCFPFVSPKVLLSPRTAHAYRRTPPALPPYALTTLLLSVCLQSWHPHLFEESPAPI